MNKKLCIGKITFFVLLVLTKDAFGLTYSEITNRSFKVVFEIIRGKEFLVLEATEGTVKNEFSFDSYFVRLRDTLEWTESEYQIANLETEQTLHKSIKKIKFGKDSSQVTSPVYLTIEEAIIPNNRCFFVLVSSGEYNEKLSLHWIWVNASEMEPINTTIATNAQINALISLVFKN